MAADGVTAPAGAGSGGGGSPALRVREGDPVVLDVNGDRAVLATASRGAKLRLRRSAISLAPLLGQPFGAVLRVSPDGRRLEPAPGGKQQFEWETEGITAARTNAQLLDENTAQGLSHAEIEEMKRGGTSGAELVEALVRGSATFEGKTEFSQDKFRRKKAKKFLTEVAVHRPCARAVCEALHSRDPKRLAGMRADTLSLLLLQANLGPGARALVVEACGGVVAGAALERLGGEGMIVAAAPASGNKSLELIRAFGLPREAMSIGRQVPITRLVRQVGGLGDEGEGESDGEGEVEGEGGGEGAGQEREQVQDGEGAGTVETAVVAAMEEEGGGGTGAASTQQEEGKGGEGELSAPPRRPRGKRGRDGAAKQQKKPGGGAGPKHLRRLSLEDVAALREDPFTSLVLAAPHIDAKELILATLPLCAPSASFTLFSPWLQVLADCQYELQARRLAVNMTITECLWREHQVLPGRTHPHMTLAHGATGGYVLCGTRLAQEADERLPSPEQK